jgi:hypothetical protein
MPTFRGPPRGIGCDFAGEIVGVGGGATSHYIGERVFGSLLPFGRDGSLAEYVVVSVDVSFRFPVVDTISGRCPSPAERRCRRLPTGRDSPPASACWSSVPRRRRAFAVQVAKHLDAPVVSVAAPAMSNGSARWADEVVDYARRFHASRRSVRHRIRCGGCVVPAARRVLPIPAATSTRLATPQPSRAGAGRGSPPVQARLVAPGPDGRRGGRRAPTRARSPSRMSPMRSARWRQVQPQEDRRATTFRGRGRSQAHRMGGMGS